MININKIINAIRTLLKLKKFPYAINRKQHEITNAKINLSPKADALIEKIQIREVLI